MRETPGGSRCQDDLRPDIGLGNTTVISILRIEWPSGTVQEFTDVAADQILSITEPRRPVVSVTTVSSTRVEDSVRGDPNTAYQVEVSTDLGTWESLGGITTDATGNGAWSEANPPAGTRRFYRAKGRGQ